MNWIKFPYNDCVLFFIPFDLLHNAILWFHYIYILLTLTTMAVEWRIAAIKRAYSSSLVEYYTGWHWHCWYTHVCCACEYVYIIYISTKQHSFFFKYIIFYSCEHFLYFFIFLIFICVHSLILFWFVVQFSQWFWCWFSLTVGHNQRLLNCREFEDDTVQPWKCYKCCASCIVFRDCCKNNDI